LSRSTLAFVALCAVVLAGCESSQDKSARLSKQGKHVFSAKGLTVTRQNGQVKVAQTAVLHDANGSAAVVVLTNRSPAGMANVPLSIEVRGPDGKPVFKNDAPGLEPSLVGVSALPGRGTVTWVNDQVTAAGTPKSVAAAVGTAKGTLSANPPAVRVESPTLTVDPVSGVEASGKVVNTSKVDQRALVIYCVARKGGRIVAAGRGQVQKLGAGKTAKYHLFFIGNPQGAKLSVDAPPTVLG
jgi:hypothetical protein